MDAKDYFVVGFHSVRLVSWFYLINKVCVDVLFFKAIQITLVGKYRLVLNCFSVEDIVTVEKNKMTDQKRTSGT